MQPTSEDMGDRSGCCRAVMDLDCVVVDPVIIHPGRLAGELSSRQAKVHR
jgi:hypothetical protein